jgi:3-isopropylmalate/(R)-2-methylmalate dehydratase small subunit
MMPSQSTGTAIALHRDDVDTDQIVPAEFCKRITKSGYDDALFVRWRQDPDFPLNRPEAAGAKVLIAGHNFGTGSSREHAVWALRDWGFEAVLATSFGDIFRRNALKNRLLPVELAPEAVRELAALADSEPGTEVCVDLVDLVVRAGALRHRFALDERSRGMLLDDLDEIAATLADDEAIRAHERVRFDWLPTGR